MPALEILSRETWEEFVASPRVFLMIGKSDCPACNEWTTGLEEFLAADSEFPDVRFGKVLLDTPGLGGFKKANAWLAAVHDLPYNVVFRDGARVKEWVGGGVDRMVNRLRRLTT